MSQPVKRRSKLPTITGNKGEELSVAVIHAVNEPGQPSSNNNNVVFAPESGTVQVFVSASFGKKNNEKCSAKELVKSALLDAFIGFFRENATPMRIQHVSDSEALEGLNTRTNISLQMFPAPLSRLLVNPQQLKRLESLSITLALKASPSSTESQDQATNLLRKALLTNKRRLPASYSSLIFRAAHHLAKNLASRYPAIFNTSWVERLLADSASYRSISRSVTGLLRRPYPAIADQVSSVLMLLGNANPSSIPAEDSQDTPQYDDQENSQLYMQASQTQSVNTDNQEAIQKAMFALALHQTKRTSLFTDKEPAKEWEPTQYAHGPQFHANLPNTHHKVSRSRSSSIELEEMPPTKKKAKLDKGKSVETNDNEDSIIISSASEDELPTRKRQSLCDAGYELAVSLFRGHERIFASNDDLVIEDPDTEGKPPPPEFTRIPPLTDMHIDAEHPHDLYTHAETQPLTGEHQDSNASPTGDFIIQTPPSSDEDIILEPEDDDDNMMLDDSLRHIEDRVASLAYRESRSFAEEDLTPASSSQSTQDSGYTTLPSSQANSQDMIVQKSWQNALNSQIMQDVEKAVDKMIMAVKAGSDDEILYRSDEE